MRYLLNLACLSLLVCWAHSSQAVVFHTNYSHHHYCDVQYSPQFITEYCYYPGPGPLIVLMPNLGGNQRIWSVNFIRAINRFAGVLTYNRPGYGASEWRTQKRYRWIGVNTQTQQLHALLTHLKSQKKVIMLAYGGAAAYAQYFARIHPQQVSALALINPVSLYRSKKDYDLAYRKLPAQRSIGIKEYMGLDQFGLKRNRLRKKILKQPTLLISLPSEWKAKRSLRRWRSQQKRLSKRFKSVEYVSSNYHLSEAASVSHQKTLLNQLKSFAYKLDHA